jgi:predicted 3-demethylubiquinone-9 3-methyltransferase (glyoxalase superfamily)
MFQGDAEKAMNFYVSLFPEAKVLDIKRYGPGEAGAEGSIMQARFVLQDQVVMCIDSPIKHAFNFTPSFSFFVTCETEDEIQRFYEALSEGGGTLMPLDNYGFSRKFGWVNDRFGVSWQINLP